MTEREIQNAVMDVLGRHPLVAWVYVISVGTYRGHSGGRPIKIGFPGQADIMGQMKDGRILAIEVKKPGQKPRADQYEFLQLVSRHNGLAGWCDSAESALAVISGDESAYSVTGP